jgi:hypothetical protein
VGDFVILRKSVGAFLFWMHACIKKNSFAVEIQGITIATNLGSKVERLKRKVRHWEQG